MSAAFTELHACSAFSFLYGASLPEVMVERAADLGYDSIAITDRAGFYASARAHHAAVEHGIRAIVGSVLDLPDGSRFPVLCATRDGYRMMSRHLTDRHLLPEVEHALRPAAGHLIALTGDRGGPICRHLLKNDKPGALAAAERMVGMFGRNNLYVELIRQGLRDDGRLNRLLMDLAGHLKLPVIASNAPLYANREDRILADAFTCLRHHVPLDGAGRLLARNTERHLKPPQEMAALFADLPEAIINTRRLADRIGFTLENLDYRFPDFPDEKGNPLSIDGQAALLRRLAYEGASHRYGKCSYEVKEQLEKELGLIHQLGFPGYFLIVREIVEYARGRGILCQGRGSAANSVVCYVLGITAVDPVKNRLLFERFLSENRRSWPDIDIDFPSGEKREEVIQHVFKKYGERGAAMTANVIRYRSKLAFREMSKVLGFPPSVAERFSATPSSFKGEGSNGKSREERELDFDERVTSVIPPSHPRLEALTRLYFAAVGMPRHLGQHPGGIIVCDHGLDSSVPLQPATMPGRNIVQWDKDDCDEMGIVKIDLLGLGMLAAIEHALEIRTRRGDPMDLADIPTNDKAVFDMLCRADTIGTFQVESRAQMATLPIMRPKKFYDLVIEVAIIRPGPIVGNLVHPYLNRRSGREKPDYIHRACRKTLKRTLGIPLFQEQVLRIAMEVAGFSGGEADELRKAMDFKRDDSRMQRVTAKLRQRMDERGIDPVVREKVVDSIGSFALYGFPESHAISFAMIANASCWLKVHHPAEFYTGLINNQPMGFYSVNTLIQDAKRHGIRMLPVSCVWSEEVTAVLDDSTLRLGLLRLKGLGRVTAERIVRERKARPYDSLEDFLSRVRPTEKEKRLLAHAGALNDLPQVEHRREALWQVELPLFDDLLTSGNPTHHGIMPRMEMAERLSSDLATQGASIGPHPMRLWRERMGTRQYQRARDLHYLPSGFPIKVAGMVICRQRPGTAKGHCFISLEDETGIANLFVKKETFHAFRLVITSESFLSVAGRLQRSEGDQPTVYVTGISPLEGMDRGHAAESHDFH
ncbi:error-prone DNA polymerase [Luteolibacter yonseiensis]|uniref:Error-prone DNA polymerase n=1 Tax=Luteolibacter yonseiensis TaxID=1144680 RepID=A0A934R6A5_9BACT|nr:error-prone DNA polymerase [Luteolibacter yonseiensis]MBK1818021.1 error-prone DNA polymerase [Luteolibacter yonseiensis]